MYRPERVTAAAETPVTVAEAKAQCRVDHSTEDTFIGTLVDGATAHMDGYSGVLGRCLVTQAWKQEFDGFSRCMRLPLLAAGITSIIYQDSSGQLSTVNASNYTLQHDELGSYVRFKDDFAYPGDLYQTKAVAITFTAGYGGAADVPAAIKAAILLLAAHWYENRESVVTGTIATSLPMAVDALLAPYRRVGV